LGLGRWSRWHGNRRGTFLAQVGEDPRDHAGFGDGGNPPEASAALSPLIEPLELTDADASNLVAFLKALTSR